jgi:hypothetical protein
MKKYLFVPFISCASHLVPIIFIFAFSVLLRYPYFLNNDHFFSADMGLMANTIIDMLNGGPIVFYYDFARYFGLTGGVLAVPIMWLLGFNTMAFSLPGTLFFSLYAWTLYLIAKSIVPREALLILILILFAPPSVVRITAQNWPHFSTAFLGNLIFLFYIKTQTFKYNKGPIIFFLFFAIGFSIYTYTFSLIYISVIVLLHLLSYPQWNKISKKLSYSSLLKLFKGQKNKVEKLVRFLDMLILLFLVVIIFSYIFGGFGFDLAGISIFQVNNLHKPVFQLLGLLSLRILVCRKDLINIYTGINILISKKISEQTRNLVLLGGSGFLLGLSPRIVSVLIGETSRGGQGFDVDFDPFKLVAHSWDIIVRTFPHLFSLDHLFDGWTSSVSDFGNVFNMFGVPFLLLLVASTFSFYSCYWRSFKKILTLKRVKFNPRNIFIVLPVLTCLANVLIQNGSQSRYLFPMYGTIILWIGVFVNNFKGKIKGLPILVLSIWVGFYSIANYNYYKSMGLIDSFQLVKFERIEIHDLVEFLESKSIEVAYSDYEVSSVGTYLSEGKINISEYSDNPKSKAQKRRSLAKSRFAIIARNDEINIYNNYLLQNKIEFKVNDVKKFKVYWDFSGDQSLVDNLRILINES